MEPRVLAALQPYKNDFEHIIAIWKMVPVWARMHIHFILCIIYPHVRTVHHLQ